MNRRLQDHSEDLLKLGGGLVVASAAVVARTGRRRPRCGPGVISVPDQSQILSPFSDP
jgi:hypothetical protein